MRVLGTVFFGFFFVVVFVAFFLVRSLTAFPLDTDATVDALRAADLRETVLTSLEAGVESELEAQGATPAQVALLERLRPALATALNDEIFYGLVRNAHTILVESLRGDAEETTVDFREIKVGLERALVEASPQAIGCPEALGLEACEATLTDPVMAAYVAQVRRALRSIPDEVPVTDLMKGSPGLGAASKQAESGAGELEELRRWMSLLETAETVAMISLFVLLFIIALLNLAPFTRALIATGIVVTVAAVTSLASANTLAPIFAEMLQQAVLEQSATDSPAQQAIAEGLARAGVELFEGAIRHSNEMVIGILVAGAALLFAGVAVSLIAQRAG